AAAPLPRDTVAAEPLESPELGRFQTPREAPAPIAPAPAVEPEPVDAAAAAPAPAAAAPFDGTLRPPVPGAVVKPYSRDPGPNRNDGVDFAATPGEPVRAAASGEVALVSTSLGEWGTIVLVRHPGNLMTVYGRLGAANVEKGQQVAAGEVLGQVAADQPGRTLMHFEVRRGAFSEDPAEFL
ncbi:MAG: M23 family metallopeptidase, partial [Pseudomonadota bacterium]